MFFMKISFTRVPLADGVQAEICDEAAAQGEHLDAIQAVGLLENHIAQHDRFRPEEGSMRDEIKWHDQC